MSSNHDYTHFIKEIDCRDPLSFFRALIVAEIVHNGTPLLYINDVIHKANTYDLRMRLSQYHIPPGHEYEFGLYIQAYLIRKQIQTVEDFQCFVQDAFPHLFKNTFIIDLLKATPLNLYIAVYHLLSSSASYKGSNAYQGSQYADQVYLPRQDMWASLGIPDLNTFFQCWQSLNYYESQAEEMYIPSALKDAIEAYKKFKVPKPSLLTHYVVCLSWYNSLDETSRKKPHLNPWEECRKIYSDTMIERGMTQEEALFNGAILNLIAKSVKPTDVINALFYQHRSDILEETYILFPTMQMDIGFAQNVLVVNPSPDFLVQYGECSLTKQKQTIFVVTDATVAKAYALQFVGWPYRFVTPSYFESKPNVPGSNALHQFDYLLYMARDSRLSTFSDAFSRCVPGSRILCALPQTALTTKVTEENIDEVFQKNTIGIDSILELPAKLSGAGKNKKMLIRARADVQPSHFALLTSTCFSLDETTHYTVVDRSPRFVPSEQLRKRRTVKQMRDYHDNHPDTPTIKASEEDSNNKGFHFSKDIAIRCNLYQEADGQYTARAYRRFISKQYGQSERNSGKKEPKKIRTDYYYPGPCSLEEIFARITKWVLRPNIMKLIVRDIEAAYEDHPQDLSLKTVWYCLRADLKATYMSYEDKLAIDLFCGKDQTLSDLELKGIHEESILDALAQTAPGCEEDPRYRRLLDLIFRMAVRRGFLDVHPFTPEKTSLEQDRKKAMRQLRDALGKDSLSFTEMRKVLAFLLEPVDEQNTPRAVRESRWLIPLIRLCTGMPLREICSLQWKDFHQIEDFDAYQLHVTKLTNDANESVPITSYRYVRKYRKVPCVTILSEALLQRLKYMEKTYGISPKDAMSMPMIFSEEPGTKRKGRPKGSLQCTIQQARKMSAIAMAKAEIPSDVITLLDGEAAFQEDLNACRNDLFYSNFLHYLRTVCGLSEGQICYIVGRKAPNCFSEHYVDFRNDFIQLAMVQRMDRLWALVQAENDTQEYTYTASHQNADHTSTVDPPSNALASAEVTIIPEIPFSVGDIRIRVECQRGAECKITSYTKEIIQ